MSTLTPDDFTDEEKEAINFRLQVIDDDISQLQAQTPDPNTKFDAVAIFDGANQRVQDAAIAAVITNLHAVITQRDIDDAANSPHSIRFNPPPGSGDGFPVAAPELFASDDLPTYLGALPSYDVPSADATLVNGTESPVTGGWEMWREESPGPGREVAPTQPAGTSGSPDELTAEYFEAITEFDERNSERLDVDIGSYVLKQFILSQISTNANIIALLQQRKAFWEGLGFPTE